MYVISSAFLLLRFDIVEIIYLILSCLLLSLIFTWIFGSLIFRLVYIPKRDKIVTELSLFGVSDMARNTIIRRQKEEIQNYVYRLGICTNDGIILPRVFISWNYITLIEFRSKNLHWWSTSRRHSKYENSLFSPQIVIYAEFTTLTNSDKERKHRAKFIRLLPDDRNVRSLVDETIIEIERYKSTKFPIIDDYIYHGL